MNIRRAEEKDIETILSLLSQVLELHAAIRPDYFISGTTKYTAEELSSMVRDDLNPIYVAADENDSVLGYVFCEIREQPATNNQKPFRYIYIDDLCVDEKSRGRHIAGSLFEFVREEAVRLGCYEITLNVWEGNDSARKFYEKMGLRPLKTTMEFILPGNGSRPAA